jgi:hypothetical protein
MEMQQVRYFLALCDEQNFTRAAKRCGVTQPSLTRAIKELEAELGGLLFMRSRRTSQLSSLGAIVRPYLAEIDRTVADAKREAADLLAGRSVLTHKLKESSMRKVVFGAAIAAAVLIVAGVVVRPPRPADASPPAQASEIVDIYKLEATIDVKALPKLDVDWQN